MSQRYSGEGAYPAAGRDSSKAVFGRFFERYTDEFYLLFRLLFSFMIAIHGAQKAFHFGDFPAHHELDPLVDIAGWVELVAAPLIAVGLLTRLAAGALVVQMAVAYLMIHLPYGVWPHLYPEEGFAGFHNGGEVVLLMFGMAGIIGVMGSRKWGIEYLIFKKELL